MSQLPISIPNQPTLKPGEDYYRLRREGIGFIEQMGSSQWTDYNTHDPGITILEALCYAITDLAYRTGWDIKDILAPDKPPTVPDEPFPDQPFFTARKILTVNPWTPDDFRRLLIDLATVRNAWVICKECACDLQYYAWCENGQLMLSYQEPVNPPLQPPKKVEPLGLYEILLELETDPELGDLNDKKIEHSYTVFDDADGKPHSVTMEVRFPDWGLANHEQWKLFLEDGASFKIPNVKFGATKTFDVLTDPSLKSDGERDKYLRDHWRNVFYVCFEIELLPGGQKISIENAALRLFGDPFSKSQATVNGLKTILEDVTAHGFIQRYRNKLLKINQAVDAAKASLLNHRNLDEDYCRVRGVAVEDVAICADVEVSPDADIERVQAKIWFEIEQHFNPPVPFYTLQEMMEAGLPVEDIFNGPELENGFIKTDELAAAELKSVLRTSDIINRLMRIEGVVAITNLQLSNYDAEGNVIRGAADPTWSGDTPSFDANKTSASWVLFVSKMHQPRLYHNLSRFLFYKNGLPFLPRMDEAYDTLTQLRGEAERPKIKNAPKDLTVPVGTFRNPEDYSPVQDSFPATYGIGPEGLPSHASSLRRAQARQLKAYLMVFDQLLGNALAQLAHTADLFSLSPSVKRTYFVREFSGALIQGYNDITNSLNLSSLESMTETQPEFLERRNRFLDHIMARFGEQFGEYALLLTNLQGQPVALDRLIDDKISFLKAYPRISHDRGKAFNYKVNPSSPGNIAGLKKRVSLLLGFPDLTFSWTLTGTFTVASYQLMDGHGKVWMGGPLTLVITDPDDEKARQTAFQTIIKQMNQPDAYEIVDESGGLRLKLKDANNKAMGQYPTLFPSKAEAKAWRDELLSWSANERAIVVEHLLLRPKFPGDALYPACTEGACATCGDEDPYSFRLTFVMPGWIAPFNTNLELRGFADRTIRQETPSHLLGKICWVGNDGFITNPCNPIFSQLLGLLETKGLTAEVKSPSRTASCECANAIYAAFSKVFKDWYEHKTLEYVHPDALKIALEKEFNSNVNLAEISCTAVLSAGLSPTSRSAILAEVQAIMLKCFQDVALNGWQFERFEDAWHQWLEANAAIDWTEERLQERVEAILASNLATAPATANPPEEDLCKCATAILTKYGMGFQVWMRENLKLGNAFEEFTDFVPDPVTLCAGFTFKTGAAEQIESLLKDRYGAYQKVSYCLWRVVNLLAKLGNAYPGATLHDCDDGSDQNPVRLGSTALGA